MRTAAIIITFNRFDLLKECITGIKNQEIKPDEIIVVDNNSTDGTGQWLAQQEDLTVITQENSGCSGGVYAGLKYAYAKGYDWFWIMDDDTIPYETALSTLHHYIEVASQTTGINNLGYLGSKVIWKDGTPHLMNLPHIAIYDPHGKPFNLYDQLDLYGISASSFVSLMLSRKALSAVGLPVRDFYIWGDDTEYTRRIVRAGFQGFYAPKSVVLHATAVNYSADIFSDTPNNIWKYHYGIRNELYMFRHFGSASKFYSKLLKRVLVMPIRIFKKRKDHRWAFIKANWKASFSAIGFHPTIDQI